MEQGSPASVMFLRKPHQKLVAWLLNKTEEKYIAVVIIIFVTGYFKICNSLHICKFSADCWYNLSGTWVLWCQFCSDSAITWKNRIHTHTKKKNQPVLPKIRKYCLNEGRKKKKKQQQKKTNHKTFLYIIQILQMNT